MRDRLLEAAALALEALWVYAGVAFLAGTTMGAREPSVAAALAAAFGGFWLARLFQHLEFPAGTLRIAWTVVSLAAVLSIARLEYAGDLRLWGTGPVTAAVTGLSQALETDLDVVLGAAMVTVLWVRSAARALGTVSRESVLVSFSVGFAVVVAVLVVGGPAAGQVALPFFILGLAALALSQERRLDQPGGEAALRGREGWATTLVVTLGGMTAVAALFTLLPGTGVRALLLPVVDAVLRALNLALLVALYPVFWLVVKAMEWLIPRLFGGEVDVQPPELIQDEGLRDLERHAGDSLWADLLSTALAVAVLVVVSLLVVWVMARVFRRLFGQRPAGEGVAETASGEGSLGEDLRALWRGLASRLRRGEAAGGPALPPGILRVRDLYLRMLRRAADEGLERPPARTPGEFAPDLGRHYGSAAPMDITDAFVEARYGAREPGAGAVEDLERRWREVRGRGR